MSKILAILKMIFDIFQLLKDSDGDGRPDIFDKDPADPNVK